MWTCDNQAEKLRAYQKAVASRHFRKETKMILDTQEVSNAEVRRFSDSGETIDVVKLMNPKVAKVRLAQCELTESDRRWLQSQGWRMVGNEWVDFNIHGQGVDPRLIKTHLMNAAGVLRTPPARQKKCRLRKKVA